MKKSAGRFPADSKFSDLLLCWITNFLETLLVQVWYPMTVATHSRACKAKILKNLEETGDPGGIMFKLHDFGPPRR